LLEAGSWHAFNPYGLNALVAWLAIELAIAASFVRPAGRATALSAMFLLSTAAEIVAAAIKLGLVLLAPAAMQIPWWNSAAAELGLFAVTVGWWIGAAGCVVQSLEAQSRLWGIGKVAALWLALFVANALVPQTPVFQPPNFDPRNSNWWEALNAIRQEKNGGRAASADVARLEKAQPALLQAEVARLAPQRKGVTDVYALGIAGWTEQDVFAKELDGALTALASVLPIKDRMVRLINNRETLDNIPLASLQNFTAAVHAIGDVMDKNEDVLVLVMTSHGEQTGFALQLPGGMNELTPEQGRGDARRRGHQESRGDRLGVFCRNLHSAVEERQYDRDDRGGCEEHLIRLRAGTRLDLFRRRAVSAEPASGNRFRKRLRPCPRPDPRLGTDGSRRAVESASPVRTGAGRQARAAVCVGTERGAVAAIHEIGHATSRTRPHALSDAHKSRSSRKRSTGAADLMARIRHRRTPVH
jgi:hypothetical protein